MSVPSDSLVTNSASIDLNEQQLAAVAHTDSVLVLSGAGTGKTRVIVARVARLLADGVPHEAIMAVTFTNKAANEMRTRLGLGYTAAFIGTFHSYCARLLRKHAEIAGLPNNFKIIDRADQDVLIRRILQNDLNLPKPNDGGPHPREVSASINRFKEARKRVADISPALSDPRIIDAYEIYEQHVNAEGKVDFAELLLRTCELLEEQDELRLQLCDQYRHILIDELQDINPLQFCLIKLLKGKDTVFFGVGDDDQSIYRFRGADPSLMGNFARHFTGEKIIKLERNYRSTNRILLLANAVIARNRNRLGKTLTGILEEGQEPILTIYDTDEVEAKAVARQVAKLQQQGIDLDEIAVLYRNHALANLIEQNLVDQQVPFRIHGGPRFFERAEIKDVLAYLQVAAYPDDLDAILRSINNPPRKVGNKKREQLLEAVDQDSSPWAFIEAADHEGMRAYVAIINEIKDHVANGNLVDAVRAAVISSGLQVHLVNRHEHERAEHLDEIVNAAARFVEREEGGLHEFLATLKIDSDIEDANSQVSLMTIHAAKGLEFSYLFLVGLEGGILPGWNKGFEDIQEERRLLYVAITRCRKELRLSCVTQRRQKGILYAMSKSSLLDDIDTNLLQEDNQSTASRATHKFPLRSSPPQRPPSPAHAAGGYQVGQKVHSEKFGPGVILSLNGSGDKTKANVLFFNNRKKRWLLLSLANLRKF